MQKWVVALLLGVAVVAACANVMAPASAPVVVVAPTKEAISFSDGHYTVGSVSGTVGSSVIAADTYYTDGRGGPNDLCFYRVTRGGVGVEGAMWKADTKVHNFTVQAGDEVEIELGCKVYSSP